MSEMSRYLADEMMKQAMNDAVDCSGCGLPECEDCHLLMSYRVPKDCNCSLCIGDADEHFDYYDATTDEAADRAYIAAMIEYTNCYECGCVVERIDEGTLERGSMHLRWCDLYEEDRCGCCDGRLQETVDGDMYCPLCEIDD